MHPSCSPSAARGESLLGLSVAQRVLAQLVYTPSQPPVAVDPPTSSAIPPAAPILSELTTRELNVLRLIAQGLRKRAIAERLVISEKTVQNHVSNIFAKLHVNDRSQAIIHALHGGLLERNKA